MEPPCRCKIPAVSQPSPPTLVSPPDYLVAIKLCRLLHSSTSPSHISSSSAGPHPDELASVPVPRLIRSNTSPSLAKGLPSSHSSRPSARPSLARIITDLPSSSLASAHSSPTLQSAPVTHRRAYTEDILLYAVVDHPLSIPHSEMLTRQRRALTHQRSASSMSSLVPAERTGMHANNKTHGSPSSVKKPLPALAPLAQTPIPTPTLARPPSTTSLAIQPSLSYSSISTPKLSTFPLLQARSDTPPSPRVSTHVRSLSRDTTLSRRHDSPVPLSLRLVTIPSATSFLDPIDVEVDKVGHARIEWVDDWEPRTLLSSVSSMSSGRDSSSDFSTISSPSTALTSPSLSIFTKDDGADTNGDTVLRENGGPAIIIHHLHHLSSEFNLSTPGFRTRAIGPLPSPENSSPYRPHLHHDLIPAVSSSKPCSTLSSRSPPVDYTKSPVTTGSPPLRSPHFGSLDVPLTARSPAALGSKSARRAGGEWSAKGELFKGFTFPNTNPPSEEENEKNSMVRIAQEKLLGGIPKIDRSVSEPFIHFPIPRHFTPMETPSSSSSSTTVTAAPSPALLHSRSYTSSNAKLDGIDAQAPSTHSYSRSNPHPWSTTAQTRMRSNTSLLSPEPRRFGRPSILSSGHSTTTGASVPLSTVPVAPLRVVRKEQHQRITQPRRPANINTGCAPIIVSPGRLTSITIEVESEGVSWLSLASPVTPSTGRTSEGSAKSKEGKGIDQSHPRPLQLDRSTSGDSSSDERFTRITSSITPPVTSKSASPHSRGSSRHSSVVHSPIIIPNTPPVPKLGDMSLYQAQARRPSQPYPLTSALSPPSNVIGRDRSPSVPTISYHAGMAANVDEGRVVDGEGGRTLAKLRREMEARQAEIGAMLALVTMGRAGKDKSKNGIKA